jgi:acyl dehydratase
MSMFVPAVLNESASLGSPGVDELRWRAPVRPGDTLRGRSTVTDVKPSSTNPSRGTVFTTNELVNQDDVVVLTFTARGLFARRPA